MLADCTVGGFARFVGAVIMGQLDKGAEQQHRHKRIEPAPPVVGEGWRKALGEGIVTASGVHGAQSKKNQEGVQANLNALQVFCANFHNQLPAAIPWLAVLSGTNVTGRNSSKLG